MLALNRIGNTVVMASLAKHDAQRRVSGVFSQQFPWPLPSSHSHRIVGTVNIEFLLALATVAGEEETV
jgi:hypothetical protein